MMRRIDVTSSADGVRLAVWVDGTGPPLVLVHGSLQDHSASQALVSALAGDFTTYSLDRRGFGASDDGPEYSLEHEFADVAAVIDAAAEECGAPAAVWGHSFGGGCAIGGAAAAGSVSRLVIYEPSLGLRYPAGSIEAIEAMVEAGDAEGATVTVLREIVGMSEEEVEAVRRSEAMPWEARLAVAPTIPRECRAEHEWSYEPGRFDALAAPTLLLAGSDSPPELRATTEAAAGALPSARIETLEGHAHTAHREDPDLVADLIRAHLASDPES